MAKRIENECAYCAEEMELEQGIVGQDWKVYCSAGCARAGEEVSQREWQRLMRDITSRRNYVVQEQTC